MIKNPQHAKNVAFLYAIGNTQNNFTPVTKVTVNPPARPPAEKLPQTKTK